MVGFHVQDWLVFLLQFAILPYKTHTKIKKDTEHQTDRIRKKKNFLCHILVKILSIKNKGGTENRRREDTKENPINKEKTNQNDI